MNRGHGGLGRSLAQSSTQHWLWVTRPKHYELLSPWPDSGWDGWWTCDEETQKGDIALLYRTSPRSDIAYIFLVKSNPYSLAGDPEAEELGWMWECEYTCLAALEHPVPFKALKSCEELSEWKALRAWFRGRGGTWEIPDEVRPDLYELIASSNPALSGAIERQKPVVDAQINDEKALEDLLASDMARLGAAGVNLQLLGRQFVCTGPRWRIDLLAEDRRRRSRDLWVIELKMQEADRKTFGQVSAYMGWVEKHLAKRRQKVFGLVVSPGTDESFDYARLANPNVHSVHVDDVLS